jgi:hypothetical protein
MLGKRGRVSRRGAEEDAENAEKKNRKFYLRVLCVFLCASA